MSPPYVAIECDTSFTVFVIIDDIRMRDIFVSIDKNVRMCISPYERAILKSYHMNGKGGS